MALKDPYHFELSVCSYDRTTIDYWGFSNMFQYLTEQILFLIFLFQKCIGSSCLLFLPVELCFLLFASHSLWDVRSLIRNWTHVLSKWKLGILTTRLPGTLQLNLKITLSLLWNVADVETCDPEPLKKRVVAQLWRLCRYLPAVSSFRVSSLLQRPLPSGAWQKEW